MNDQRDRRKLVEAMGREIHAWGKLNPERVAYVDQFAGADVLDLGCATGSYVDYLVRQGKNAVGADFLAYDAWAAVDGNRFLLADAANLPFNNGAFDTVLCFEVIEHIAGPGRAIREIHRVCRKNAVITVPNCERPPILGESGLTFHHYVDRSHCNFFTKKTFAHALAEAGFNVREMTTINNILPERLLAHCWGIPLKAGGLLRKLSAVWPGYRSYGMTLLAVAEK